MGTQWKSFDVSCCYTVICHNYLSTCCFWTCHKINCAQPFVEICRLWGWKWKQISVHTRLHYQQRPFDTMPMSGVLFLTRCEKAVKLNRLLKENLPTRTRPFSFVRPVRWKFLKCQLFHSGSLVSSLEHHVLFTQPVGFRKRSEKTKVT